MGSVNIDVYLVKNPTTAPGQKTIDNVQCTMFLTHQKPPLCIEYIQGGGIFYDEETTIEKAASAFMDSGFTLCGDTAVY